MKKAILLLTLILLVNLYTTAQDYYVVRDSAIARFERADYLNALYTYFYVDNLYRQNQKKHKNERNPKLWIKECKDSLSVLIVRIKEEKEKVLIEKQKSDSLLVLATKAIALAEKMQRKAETAIFDKAVKERNKEWTASVNMVGYDRTKILTEIDSLDLSKNVLFRMPEEVRECRNLKHINLLGNENIDWKQVTEMLSFLNKEVKIYITVNTLNDIDTNYWHNISGLEILKEGLTEL